MKEKLASEGVCIFCKEKIAKSSMTTHLGKHLKEIEKNKPNLASKKFYHLEAQSGPYFLHFIASGPAKMQIIDNFLRAVWLECCGHLSEFRGNAEIGMNRKIQDAFLTNEKLTYEYDFGSTTQLLIKKHGEYELPYTDTLVLLSRNEPLKILCDICNSAAAQVLCSVCLGEEESLFCENCAPKHAKTCADFADYAEMPVVNSPRMGVCGYEGGSVDVERDGIYQV